MKIIGSCSPISIKYRNCLLAKEGMFWFWHTQTCRDRNLHTHTHTHTQTGVLVCNGVACFGQEQAWGEDFGDSWSVWGCEAAWQIWNGTGKTLVKSVASILRTAHWLYTVKSLLPSNVSPCKHSPVLFSQYLIPFLPVVVTLLSCFSTVCLATEALSCFPGTLDCMTETSPLPCLTGKPPSLAADYTKQALIGVVCG